MALNERFGPRLRQLRKDADLTQKELAAHCGVDYTYISKLENNQVEYGPSQEIIHKLAGLFTEYNPDGTPSANELETELLALSGKTELAALRSRVAQLEKDLTLAHQTKPDFAFTGQYVQRDQVIFNEQTDEEHYVTEVFEPGRKFRMAVWYLEEEE